MRHIRALYQFPIRLPSIRGGDIHKMSAFSCPRPVPEVFQKAFNGTCRRVINHLHMCKTRLLFCLGDAIKDSAHNTAHSFACFFSLFAIALGTLWPIECCKVAQARLDHLSDSDLRRGE
jgi:hypothetical protein